jgi:hypothetical protein
MGMRRTLHFLKHNLFLRYSVSLAASAAAFFALALAMAAAIAAFFGSSAVGVSSVFSIALSVSFVVTASL